MENNAEASKPEHVFEFEDYEIDIKYEPLESSPIPAPLAVGIISDPAEACKLETDVDYEKEHLKEDFKADVKYEIMDPLDIPAAPTVDIPHIELPACTETVKGETAEHEAFDEDAKDPLL